MPPPLRLRHLLLLRRGRRISTCRCSLYILCSILAGVLVFNLLSVQMINSFGRDCKISSSVNQSPINWTASHDDWANGRLFPVSRPLVLLSIDYHASPVQDLIDLLGPLGVQFVQKGIAAYGCQHFNSCRSTGYWIKDMVGWSTIGFNSTSLGFPVMV